MVTVHGGFILSLPSATRRLFHTRDLRNTSTAGKSALSKRSPGRTVSSSPVHVGDLLIHEERKENIVQKYKVWS